ncbi:MAG: class I tRNA ligase family protein, partial [Candidatus Enterenecus sp.]
GDMKSLILMLSPFAPHIAEELWEMLGFAGEGFACQQKWPEYDESKTVAKEIQMAVQVNGKVRANIVVPADADNDAIVSAAQADEKVRKFTDGMTLVKSIVVPGRLVNLIVKP